MDPFLQSILSALANVPMAAVVVWVVYILLTRTLPSMQDRFDANQAKTLDFCEKQMAAEREACNTRYAELRQDHQNLVAEIQSGFRENRDCHKEARHLVGDIANTLKLKSIAERISVSTSAAKAAET